MFGYAKEHEPCIIFMDEIDAIGGRRFSEGTSADREIQRTLMELLNQLDGFDYLGRTKIIMATNRPDTLDPALLRAGRLDRKIEIPLPNEVGRLEILKIHAQSVVKEDDIDFESVVKMSDGPKWCRPEECGDGSVRTCPSPPPLSSPVLHIVLDIYIFFLATPPTRTAVSPVTFSRALAENAHFPRLTTWANNWI